MLRYYAAYEPTFLVLFKYAKFVHDYVVNLDFFKLHWILVLNWMLVIKNTPCVFLNLRYNSACPDAHILNDACDFSLHGAHRCASMAKSRLKCTLSGRIVHFEVLSSMYYNSYSCLLEFFFIFIFIFWWFVTFIHLYFKIALLSVLRWRCTLQFVPWSSSPKHMRTLVCVVSLLIMVGIIFNKIGGFCRMKLFILYKAMKWELCS